MGHFCHSHTYVFRTSLTATVAVPGIVKAQVATTATKCVVGCSHIDHFFTRNSYAYSFVHAARTNRIMGRGDDDSHESCAYTGLGCNYAAASLSVMLLFMLRYCAATRLKVFGVGSCAGGGRSGCNFLKNFVFNGRTGPGPVGQPGLGCSCRFFFWPRCHLPCFCFGSFFFVSQGLNVPGIKSPVRCLNGMPGKTFGLKKVCVENQ